MLLPEEAEGRRRERLPERERAVGCGVEREIGREGGREERAGSVTRP